MPFALSTHWNAHRHTSGEKMVAEILELGFRHIELGYNLRLDLVPGVRKMIEKGEVVVTSVHNYCPVPVGAPGGHPELFLFSSRDARERASAVQHTLNTIRFAADMQAKCVVIHAGRVKMTRYSVKMMDMAEDGKQNAMRYEKIKQKLLQKRERKVGKHLPLVVECLEEILEQASELNIKLGLENLPSWEAIPTEVEMEKLAEDFDSPHLGFWYDVGHGQIRDNLGMVSSLRWLERLQTHLVGMHIHDVKPPAHDHVMPPAGSVDYGPLKPFFAMDIPLVLEPAPETPPQQVIGAREFLEQVSEDAGDANEQPVAAESIQEVV